MRKTRKGEKGSVLILSFMTFALLFTMGQAFFARTLYEAKFSEITLSQSQAFYLAEGGKHAGLAELRERVTSNIEQQVTTITDVSILQSYVPSGSLEFLRDYSYANGGDARFAVTIPTGETTPRALLQIVRPDAGGGSYSVEIELFANGTATSPTPGVFTFPYRYLISTRGTSDLRGVQQFVQAQGVFSVTVQGDTFTRYALLTNTHASPNGSIAWFTNQTTFRGPVHTNDRFSFDGNPSGTFTDSVTQVQQTARFYNKGSNLLLDANANGETDVPNFQTSFTRGVAPIALPSALDQLSQQRTALGLTNSETIPTMAKGIYLPADGSALKGGIYVQGDAQVSLGLTASGHQTYRVTQGKTTHDIVVDPTTSTTTVTSGSSTTTYSGTPKSILYVDGSVEGFSGTVSDETQLTVSAKSDLLINQHVLYQKYDTSPTLNALGRKNMLGLISWEGNARIASSAPNDIEIHGSIMAPNGTFMVEKANAGAPRGTAILLGSVITKYYGTFGTFSGKTPTSGYGRNFVYDERMREGQSPPYFPRVTDRFVSYNTGIQSAPAWDKTKSSAFDPPPTPDPDCGPGSDPFSLPTCGT